MNRKLRVEELDRKSIQAFKSGEKAPLIVILENVRSLSNIGSVFRTADAFCIEEVILVGFTASPPHREINKTAIGATESVKWSHYSSMDEVFKRMKEQKYAVFAIEQTERSKELHQVQWSVFPRVAVILGNELSGVEQHSIDCCVESIEVPQFGTKHSLNVSVCAGVVIWHILSTQNWPNRL